MGSYSVIDFEDIPEMLLSYGIDLNAKTPEEKERVKLAFESSNSMDEFIKEVNQILKTEK